MRGAGRPVHEEGPVRRERVHLLHPCDRLVGHVLGEVVAFLPVRRVDANGVLDHCGLPLRGLSSKETIEIIEPDTFARGPVRIRPDGCRFIGRGVVPFAECCGRVAIIAKDFRDGGGGAWYPAGVSVPVVRQLGDLAVPDPMVIAPGQQCRPRGRTHGGIVEAIVGQSVLRKPAQCRRFDHSAEGVRQGRTNVVEHDDDDVRSIRGEMRLRGQWTVSGLSYCRAGLAP